MQFVVQAADRRRGRRFPTEPQPSGCGPLLQHPADGSDPQGPGSRTSKLGLGAAPKHVQICDKASLAILVPCRSFRTFRRVAQEHSAEAMAACAGPTIPAKVESRQRPRRDRREVYG